MNEKITLPALITLLSDKTGKTKKQCEDFLREFFNTIVDTLAEGENVRVKGLGTFKVITVEARKSVNVNTGEQMEIPSHRKIVFIPAKELAEEVNSPFAMFESVEIPEEEEESGEKFGDENSGDMEVAPDSEENEAIEPNAEDVPEPQGKYVIEEETVIENVDAPENHSAPETEREEPRGQEVIEEPEETEEPRRQEVIEKPEEPEEPEEPEVEAFAEAMPKTKSYRFLIGFACGLAFAALLCLGAYVFFFDNIFKNYHSEVTDAKIENPAVQKQIATTDSTASSSAKAQQPADTATVKPAEKVGAEEPAETAPTLPSDIVYDTITKTRYLTTMAKDHYGNYNLWPYIYEENKKILGHPDRIKPGTRIVVPPLSKYGVDPKNPEDIRKAKAMGVKIYARYD